MKQIYTYIIPFFFFLLVGKMSSAQHFDILNGDTINKIDVNNRKQGHWVIYGKTKRLPGYKPEDKVEEGDYKTSRKNGVWIKYFPSGKVKSEITYVNNRTSGAYKIFYENGQLQEAGNWKNNRNIGNFERFYPNGEKQQDFDFNATGKREGEQKYFYENGQVMIEGNWAGGKEDGEIKEFYANGDVKAIKVFNGGMMDAAKTQTFEPKQPIVEVKSTTEEEAKEAPAVTEEETVLGSSETEVKVAKANGTKPKVGYFNGEGQHTLYNKNRQISQKGIFRKGKLIDGKWYRYNSDGILEAIEIYKNGRYVGDGVIEK